VTAGRLHALGLRLIGDIADWPPERLQGCLGRYGLELHALAQGIDDRPVVPYSDPRSVSAENTFPADVAETGAALAQLAEQASEVSDRLTRHGFQGRTVTLKVRYGNFATITRSQTLPRPVRAADDILSVARTMLLHRTEFPRRAIRLVGLGVAGLVDETGPRQLELPLGDCWPEIGGEAPPQ